MIFKVEMVSYLLPSLKLAACPFKVDGWKTTVSFWGPACFQGRLLLVSGRVRDF